MNKINLRTIIEVFCIVSLWIMLVTAVTVMSVNRTITDTGDSSYTLIRNSKGHYWDCTEANIQVAIDDVGTDGGTVWIGSAMTITSPIKPKNYTQIDFLGNKVTLGADISFLNVTTCSYATVKNAYVYLSEYQTAPVILLYIPLGGNGWTNRVRYNTFDNINIIHHDSHWISGWGWREHNFTGIKLEINNGSMLYNTFSNIKMDGGLIGIHLEALNASYGWGNGNYFENIWIDAFVTGVEFDSTAGDGFNRNIFEHVKTQSSNFSIDGFKNISGNGNHFMNCLIWDWYVVENTSGYEWSITSSAYDTVILAEMTADVLDNGHDTNIL